MILVFTQVESSSIKKIQEIVNQYTKVYKATVGLIEHEKSHCYVWK